MSAMHAHLASALGAAMLQEATAAAPPVVAPDTIEAAAEPLRLASRERLHVLPAGAGTHLEPVPGVDFILSSQRLGRVLEHEPADLVAIVESGLPLATLEARLAAHTQRLGVDPWPGAAGATT